MGIVSVHIRDIDEDIWREARSYAVRTGLSMATVVGAALSAYLPDLQAGRLFVRVADERPEQGAVAAFEKALATAGFSRWRHMAKDSPWWAVDVPPELSKQQARAKLRAVPGVSKVGDTITG